MSFPWETAGAFYPKRDARHYLPHNSYMFSAAETYAAKAKSRPFIVDRESLHVRTLPVTKEQAEVGIDWNTLP